MSIQIRGARENNLQAVDVDIGDGLTVITGVSGSGKTSLAFDTLYHEARRRFLDVFSLGSAGLRLAPARVDAISGLGPAVAVGQNLLNRNPNSTLATSSGLHPFLRLLYTTYGVRRCPQCGTEISVLSADEIIERVVNLSAQGALSLSTPLLRRARGSHSTLLALLQSEFGAQALRVDGAAWQPHPLDAGAPHTIEIEVAAWQHAVPAAAVRQAVERAANLGGDTLVIYGQDGSRQALARSPVCAGCGAWFGELRPLHFHAPCPHCAGRGCARCQQSGLHPQAAAVRWAGLRLPDLLAYAVDDARAVIHEAGLPASAARLQSEIERRLAALSAVGLGYIALNRPSPTLSRGEAQRVRLAVVLTSRLEDMLHILDEPTVGQHPADVARLLPALRGLPGPVVYVEHDRVATAQADRAIDLGPGAGAQGGHVTFSGTPQGLWQSDTASGRFFSLRRRVALPAARPAPQQFLTLCGANLHNLQQIDVAIPLGRLTVVSGVSGSGKSTLVEDVLVASLQENKATGCRTIEGTKPAPVFVDQSPIGHNPRSNPATYTKLADIIRDLFAGASGLSASHFSFNRPEGACPACDGLGAREVSLRYLPSTWIPCEDCGGQRFSDEVLAARVTLAGQSYSIADVYAMPIAAASGLLANDSRLTAANRQAAGAILHALCDIGLGYLPLGQPSPTLSGGEAQRVKLARYLGKRSLAGQMLILDEPSTGLHPQDLAGLLVVLDRLVRAGATVLVVEHNTDVMRAADWIIDLGPGAGPHGGRLLYAGPPAGLADIAASPTAQALRAEEAPLPSRSAGVSPADAADSVDASAPGSLPGLRAAEGTPALRTPAAIRIRGARAHNLRNVDVDFPKGALTVVTGVSGSGKSSLVGDVLETEARRRFLETLSMYERQGTREGPEAPVESVSGLGVAVTISPERSVYSRRATVGTASEMTHHLAVLMAALGERRCPACATPMQRTTTWRCPACGAGERLPDSRHFLASTYGAACLTCHGVGTLQEASPAKLIIHPEKPLCAGAMYSPGFFPKGYLCEPLNHGYYIVRAIAERYGFDTERTPWNEISPEGRHAFLFGDAQPVEVTSTGRAGRTSTQMVRYPGFYGWVRDWDVGGTYTDTITCPDCRGGRLRPQYLAVTLGGHSMHEMSMMPLHSLADALDDLPALSQGSNQTRASVLPLASSLAACRRRLRFLEQVGLGYLHLDRVAATLSAGEAQRVKLAGLLGSGLTSLTVLLDEPTRGLHPREVGGLLDALRSLREEGNTVIVVEHDPLVMRAADYVIEMGPGAGAQGGQVVAQGTAREVEQAQTLTAAWLRGERGGPTSCSRRQPQRWMEIAGARANNLQGETIRLPLGTLVGVCGVSGSGKSTLLIDTLGRALAPKKHTTSVAQEPLAPGEHDSISGAPARAVLVDQARAGVVSPASLLELSRPLRELYAASEDAQALGLSEEQLGRKCTACLGDGVIRLDMGFLPDVYETCETCRGTGFLPEAWQVRLRGIALPDVFGLTIDQTMAAFGDEQSLAAPLRAAQAVGLGYLVLRQPGYTLSGGEAQRLKIARELCRQGSSETLYILDEPSVGQHLEDVARLNTVLQRLVAAGHSVFVAEHHPYVLAACDWLLELGPGGGPEGGHVIAAGPPDDVARGTTPIAPYLREVLATAGADGLPDMRSRT